MKPVIKFIAGNNNEFQERVENILIRGLALQNNYQTIEERYFEYSNASQVFPLISLHSLPNSIYLNDMPKSLRKIFQPYQDQHELNDLSEKSNHRKNRNFISKYLY